MAANLVSFASVLRNSFIHSARLVHLPWRRAFAANQMPSSPIPLLAVSVLGYLLPIICTPNQ
jgi:hypothetical protein